MYMGKALIVSSTVLSRMSLTKLYGEIIGTKLEWKNFNLFDMMLKLKLTCNV